MAIKNVAEYQKLLADMEAFKAQHAEELAAQWKTRILAHEEQITKAIDAIKEVIEEAAEEDVEVTSIWASGKARKAGGPRMSQEVRQRKIEEACTKAMSIREIAEAYGDTSTNFAMTRSLLEKLVSGEVAGEGWVWSKNSESDPITYSKAKAKGKK